VEDALPAAICSRWRIGIVAAAVAFFAGTPGRPYTDIKTAADHELVFLNEVSNARYGQLTGSNKADVFMRPVLI
jgi:hypothetical protein